MSGRTLTDDAVRQQLETLELSQTIHQSAVPRLTAIHILTARLNVLFFVKDIEAAEILLTAFTWWWLARIIAPASGFARIYYGAITKGASPEVWQMGFFLLAMLCTIALITGNTTLRKWSWLLGSLAWGSTSGLIFWELASPSDAALTTIFFFGTLWSYLRVAVFTPLVPPQNEDGFYYIDLT